MNPRTSYEDIDTETARAFIELFIQHGEIFKFAADSRVSDDEELRAYVIEENYQNTDDGKSTIEISGVNQTEKVNELSQIFQKMDLVIIDESEKEDYHESIGEYTVNTITAFAPKNINAEWNVPNLLVYGSLSPEIKDTCNYAFGNKYEYYDIRNHYVVRGEQLKISDKNDLKRAIENVNGFEDDKRFNKSQLNTSDFI